VRPVGGTLAWAHEATGQLPRQALAARSPDTGADERHGLATGSLTPIVMDAAEDFHADSKSLVGKEMTRE